jgi:hypothetical protein
MELLLLGGSSFTLSGTEGFQDRCTLGLNSVKIVSTVVISFSDHQHDRATILESTEYAWSRLAPSPDGCGSAVRLKRS